MSGEKVVIGNATLFHADCREVLPMLPTCDLLCTDPPYGIGAGEMSLGKWRTSRMEKADWDAETPPQWLVLLMLEKAEHKVIFGGNYFALPPRRAYLIWDKGAGFKGRDFAECEFAWCSWDGNARVLTHDPLARGDYRQKEHPTQKPLAVMQWAIEAAPASATVLDPFMGSGSTGVACVQLGRGFTGIERERKYFDIACERISRAQAQGALFPHDKPAPPVQVGFELDAGGAA
jgi:DNA modification methylase